MRGSRAKAIIVATLLFGIVVVVPGQEPQQVAADSAASRIEDLLSEDERTRDVAVDAILAERQATIERLLPLVEPANAEKYSDETHLAAAYLLGMMRATEAAPALAKMLADPPEPRFQFAIHPYGGGVLSAVVNIGRPAIPALIENLRSTDDANFRYVSLITMSHILGGKRHVQELLEKLVEQAQREEPANREASRRLREAQAHVESLLQGAIERGEKQPLY